jgi:hypothetical protein
MNMKGKTVQVVNCDRSKYMSSEFLKWIDDHKDRQFYVMEDYGNCVRLKGVGFSVTKEFLSMEA